MLPITGPPPMLEPHLEFFRPCFGRREAFEHFCEYVTGLICGVEATVEGISRIFVGHRDPSTKRRFFSDSPWSADRVMRRLVALAKREVKFKRPERGFLVIDDTDLEHDKESGKVEGGMEGLTWQKGPEGHWVKCHPLVTSLWVTPQGRFPVGYRLRLPNGVGKNRLAMWLLKRALRMGLLFKTVVFDAWYLCPLLMEFCEAHGLEWVSRLKSDRVGFVANVRVNLMEFFEGLPKSQRAKTEVDGREITYATRCVRLTDDRKVKVVAAFECGRSKETILVVASATTWTPESILRAYGLRWRIETFYRDAKQNLGLEAYMLRSVGAVKRHLALVFVAFTLLQLGSDGRRLGRLIADVVNIGAKAREAARQSVQMFVAWAAKAIVSGCDPVTITQRAYASRREVLAMSG